jgi:hypothetical protein
MRSLLLVIVCAAIVCPHPLKAQQGTAHERLALTNDAVIAMLREKFDDATIIKMIQQHNTKFDLSVNELIRLKQAGASQAVLQAMIEAVPDNQKGPNAEKETVSNAPPNNSGLPDEIGVYVRQKTGLVAIEPEVVNWQTGGVVKTLATLGLDKGHVNGTVAGPHSSFTLSSGQQGWTTGIEFIIRCADGNSASEYQLLRFWVKSDRREFRSVTGGVLHASGGAKDNVTQFQFHKLAPHTYKVMFPVHEPGEYGFLAPGMATSSDMASQGKVYTFRVIE